MNLQEAEARAHEWCDKQSTESRPFMAACALQNETSRINRKLFRQQVSDATNECMKSMGIVWTIWNWLWYLGVQQAVWDIIKERILKRKADYPSRFTGTVIDHTGRQSCE